jgi:Holliday junction DNA helicase RuvA
VIPGEGVNPAAPAIAAVAPSDRVVQKRCKAQESDSGMVRLLGLDPGLRFTGWGLIEVDGNRLHHLADGVIATDGAAAVPARLRALHEALAALLAETRPHEAAVEQTYVNRNGTATLKLGYARGIALLAPALAGVPVTEYGAMAVKQSVVGTGAAAKEQVQMMVRRLLPGAALRRAARPSSCEPPCMGRWSANGVIARLTGRVEIIDESRCLVDVSGVGYLVHASTRTLAQFPRPPASATVLVETQMREDAILLYGFADAAERDWFRLLTTVQGVGAKLALSILSALSPAELIAAIATGDRGRLTRAPGVGAKLATRLLSELREKAGAMPTGAKPGVVIAPLVGPADDALSALLNLGYRRPEASAAIARAAATLGADAAVEALIRAGLRELSG